MKREPPEYWRRKENRIKAIKWLVKTSGKRPQKIIVEDFIKHGLGVLLYYYYWGSPLAALKDAGYGIPPRKMKTASLDYWEKKENRVKAIKWLVKTSGKRPQEIMAKDFIEHGLRGLLLIHFGGSPFAALQEAGYDVLPWEMKITPHGYWNKKENRIKAIRWLVKTSGKKPEEITVKDFIKHGLRGLVFKRYNESAFAALREAGYNIPSPRKNTPVPTGYWTEKKNRTEATRRLIRTSGKETWEITHKDFNENRLKGLLDKYYNGSPFAALRDAGYDILPWEMTRVPNGYWKKIENRIDAVRWLAEQVHKPPIYITRYEFVEHGLGGLLDKYSSISHAEKGMWRLFSRYNDPAHRALGEAGLLS